MYLLLWNQEEKTLQPVSQTSIMIFTFPAPHNIQLEKNNNLEWF